MATKLKPEYRVLFRHYVGMNMVALCAIILLHLGNRVCFHLELYSIYEFFLIVNVFLLSAFIPMCLQRLDVWDDKIVSHVLFAKTVIMRSNIVGIEKGVYRGVVSYVDIFYKNPRYGKMKIPLLYFDQSRVLEALVNSGVDKERESRGRSESAD